MPLDRLQSEILRLISANRTVDSVFAGGSVLHRHAFRLSDDQDIFHPEDHDIEFEARRDIQTLREAGYDVELGKVHVGLTEAVVYSTEDAPTKLQWVQSGSWTFFAPVPDDTFGLRLHMADIAVNKILACAGRKTVRDFVDLALIHERILPLWHAAWAAPGKDASWNPRSLLEQVSRNNQFSQSQIEEEVSSLIDLDAGQITQTVRLAIEEAKIVVGTLPPLVAGSLFVDSSSTVCIDPSDVAKGLSTGRITPIGPVRGGALPSNADIDRALVESLIDTYGYEGSSIDEQAAFVPPTPGYSPT